jgi:hypothetical protein
MAGCTCGAKEFAALKLAQRTAIRRLRVRSRQPGKKEKCDEDTNSHEMREILAATNQAVKSSMSCNLLKMKINSICASTATNSGRPGCHPPSPAIEPGFRA